VEKEKGGDMKKTMVPIKKSSKKGTRKVKGFKKSVKPIQQPLPGMGGTMPY
jgi:hypothetical protein